MGSGQHSNAAPISTCDSLGSPSYEYSSYSSFRDQKLSSDIDAPVSPMSLKSPTSLTSPLWEKPTQSSTTSSTGTSISDHSVDGTDKEQTSSVPRGACTLCLSKSQTYLMEIINYPSLKHAHIRHQVLTKGAFDAIIMVYDVCDRASFDFVKELHAELAAVANGKRRKLACGTPVVAVVGNKCDLDGDRASPPVHEGRRAGSDEEVEDFDYALSLFGLEVPSEWQAKRESSAPPTPSDEHTPQPQLVPSNTLDNFLQLGMIGKSAQVVAVKAVSADTSSSGSQTAVHCGRQVLSIEGEALALGLSTPAPFFETSAKTGENVEETFEAVAKAVLKSMGRVEVNEEELTKRCLHRIRTVNEGAEPRRKAGNVAPKMETPAFGLAPESRPGQAKYNSFAQPLEIKALNEGPAVPGQEPTVEIQPTIRPENGQRQQIRGLESVMGKMRKLFMRRGSAVAEDLALQNL